MSIFDWLQASMIKLRDAGVDSPRRDCLVLIEDLLLKDRSWVLTNHDYALSEKQLAILENKLARRIQREPLAYIRGKAWFYGRFFEVNPDVLIPRPESEQFIEILKKLKPPRIVDIGTGSGCLAITTQLELPQSEIIATDIDKNTLKVAAFNAQKHSVDIELRRGSFLEPLTDGELDGSCLVVNLPYVPDGLISSPEIKREPNHALFSGKDGLDHYRKFWQAIKRAGRKPDFILTESLENQHDQMEKFARESGYKTSRTEILVQLFKKSG